MKNVNLGGSCLQVSELCLGAISFGTSMDRKSSESVLDAFIDGGGNFIDTSNNYAHWYPGATGDESETVLGEWFAKSGKRDKVVIATKVGFDRHGVGQGLKAHQIERWCDESLRKLKTDVIDLYYAHVDDADTPVEETMAAFNKLIQKGKVRAIGASNYYTWRLEEVRQACEKLGLQNYCAVQQRFSYLFTENGNLRPYPFNENANVEKLRYMARFGQALVAYSCLAGGGYADNGKLLIKSHNANYICGQRLDVLNAMAKEKNIPASSLVLAWMAHSWKFSNRPQIIPLFSASSAGHIEENIRAMDIVLSDEEAERLNEA